MAEIKKSIIVIFLVALSLPLLWFGYTFYLQDNTIHYGACGENVPVSVPFPVQYGGYELTCSFFIKSPEIYVLSLRYFYNEGDVMDSKRVRDVAGGEGWGSNRAVGGPMSISYRIVSLNNGQLLQQGKNEAPLIDSWGWGSAKAKITTLSLPAGYYQFTVKSLKSVSQMESIRTDVLISVQGGK